MTTILIVLVALAFITNIVLLVLFISRKGHGSATSAADAQAIAVAQAKNETGLKLLLEQVNEMNRTMDRKMSESARQMTETTHRQFSESKQIISDVTEKLAKLDETNRQVVSFADQLQSLQDILKNPKQRGILGEYYLETLLKNVLPPGNYQMQYAFKNGEIVDAVVFVKDKVIPIDSKFSLENYQRMLDERDPIEREKLERALRNDLKLRIQETAKYVRPSEGTMDFAFMFIPHEAIYYDLLVNKIGTTANGTVESDEDNQNFIQRAAGKYKVIIVSPTSFLAYLQTVLQGLKALQIEETAKDIIKRVEDLGTHLKKYEEYHNKVGASLNTVINHFTGSSKELKKIDKDVLRITGQAPGIDVALVEKLDLDE